MIRSAGNIIRNGYQSFTRWRNYANSRKQARIYRDTVVKYNGSSCITPEMIISMKKEMKERFGDERHWHWIALYTELRGDYIKGWMPNDIYVNEIIPNVNPVSLSLLSTYKSIDHRLFRNFTIKPIVVWINNAFYSASGEYLSINQALQQIRDLQSEVVIKLDQSASGKGIQFKDSDKVSMVDFPKHKSVLLQPAVTQHPELARIFDKCINTIRIFTVLQNDGQVSVKFRLLRIGSGGRRIVNAKMEELCVYLDENGAVISDAVNYIGLHRGSNHPDTGIPFRDIKVPSIPEAEKMCRRAHQQFPYLKIIGWDLYIAPDETPKMIEWNARQPSMWVNEVRIGPLWTDDILNGVVKKVD